MDPLEQYAKLINGWFWETDRGNRFVYMSASVETITGIPPEWHYGKARTELKGDDIDEVSWDRHIKALDAREPFYDFRFKRTGPDGESWISTSGEPFYDDNGAFAGYRGVARDISNEIALSQEAKHSRSRLQDALEIIDEGFVFYDAEDRLVTCNEKYRDYYPKSRDLIVPGARFEDIIREGAKRGEYAEAEGRIDGWVSERMAIHNEGNTFVEQKLADGRWLRIAERRTPDGGIAGFRVDITELKTARHGAEKASHAKSEFLATMSHELRTPLTSIQGSLGLIKSLFSESISDQGAELLEIASRNGEAMLTLVNELLDYEKIISGALHIETTPHDIGVLTAKVVKDNQGYANTHSVRFTFETPSTPVIANVQEHRFEQVLRNLLSNAAKFSPPGSKVKISVDLHDGQAVVTVADKGSGIPDDFKDIIFDQFTQADSSATREKKGTGLGLPISKALTEGMGGTLDFETHPGEGSIFFIRFPKTEATAKA
ncbi:MAG: PAS-domain containing protein [Rhodospirillales bacterium]|nr:PAS-domain containing protein [Alphaproteobacteria bacterium]MBL6947341.1 PAS-domain containing protein [Rhodospirillales bacterium]